VDFIAFLYTLAFVLYAYQFAVVAIGAYVWHSVRSNTLFFLLAYAFGEYLVGTTGFTLALLRINNILFHQYASLLYESMLVLFALTLLREKSNRILLKVIFFSTVIALLVLVALPLTAVWETLFNYPYLIEISVGLIVLKDRVNNHEGRTFKEDPWSVISAILIVTGCILFFTQLWVTLEGYFFPYPLLSHILAITIVVTLIIKYILISTQLWNLKRYSM